ncbi:MAG TPA: hypothetical protein VL916_16290 [Ilumatobacteraceae bacterium]|nr:hypothetical protein [Ilumatobacteraceae bacterium]
MRHAREAALDELEPLLTRLRDVPGLTERTRGVFYKKSKAFLHFHEDPTGLYADVRLTADFERFRAQTPAEQESLLAKVVAAID